jgi:hypothetical protein
MGKKIPISSTPAAAHPGASRYLPATSLSIYLRLSTGADPGPWPPGPRPGAQAKKKNFYVAHAHGQTPNRRRLNPSRHGAATAASALAESPGHRPRALPSSPGQAPSHTRALRRWRGVALPVRPRADASCGCGCSLRACRLRLASPARPRAVAPCGCGCGCVGYGSPVTSLARPSSVPPSCSWFRILDYLRFHMSVIIVHGKS